MDNLAKRLRGVGIERPGYGRGFGLSDMCDEAADLLESQATEITAKQRIIDAQAGMIADLQERLRAETTELRMQMLSDEGQHIEETGRLLKQIEQLRQDMRDVSERF